MSMLLDLFFFFFSSRRRHTRYIGDWSSDVCSSDLRGRRKSRGCRTSFPARLGSGIGAQRPSFGEECRGTKYGRLEKRRSEERRVGKECRSRRATDDYKKKRINKMTRDIREQLLNKY